MDKLIDKVLELMSYKIEEIQVDEDKATVDYVLSSPDYESIEMDENKMLADLGIDDEAALVGIMLDVLGVKDEEEAQEFKQFVQSIKPSDFSKMLKDNDHFENDQ